MISLRLAALLLVATATVAPAQGTIVDEGTFVVTRNGADAGRESFRITRESTAAGVSYSATGTRSGSP